MSFSTTSAISGRPWGSMSSQSPISDAAVEDLDPNIESQEKDVDKAEDSSVKPTAAVVKRPRGRPRKDPPSKPRDPSTIKVRSTTGCLSCRRRKKKCDEAKPTCENCERHGTQCLGYQDAEAQRVTGQGRRRRVSTFAQADVRNSMSLQSLADIVPSLQSPIRPNSIDSNLDQVLFNHFRTNLSSTLSLAQTPDTPFNDLLAPLALHDVGLMQAILCLSANHYMKNIHLPGTTAEDINHRNLLHCGKAIRILKEKNVSSHECGTKSISDATIAHMLIASVAANFAGGEMGSYILHLKGALHLIRCQQSSNRLLQKFLVETVLYYASLSAITSHVYRRPRFARALPQENEWTEYDLLCRSYRFEAASVRPGNEYWFGVMDGFLTILPRIAGIRDNIRQRQDHGMAPMIESSSLVDARDIDAEIRRYASQYEQNSPQHMASELFRLCMTTYLRRTMQCAPSTLRSTVNHGISRLRSMSMKNIAPAVILMPAFVLGYAAFDQDQRMPIRLVFQDLYKARRAENIKQALDVIEMVWSLMDAGDEANWDLESIMEGMGYQFLLA